MQSLDSTNGKTFWKKSSKPFPGRAVYGAMHPPIGQGSKAKSSSPQKEKNSSNNTRGNESSSSSFRDYWESVNDAWDCGDDEFANLADGKISNEVAKSAAQSVLNSHRSGQLQPLANEQTGKTEDSPQADIKSKIVTSDGGKNATESSISSNPCIILPSNHHQHNNLRERLTHDPDRERGRIDRFEGALYDCKEANVPALRDLSWSGIPAKMRADTWRTLNGYLPANAERRQETLERKRAEYWSIVKKFYHTRHDDLHTDTFRQIHIDIPRMAPLISLLQQSIVQEMFERILFIWAIRHPASGYVQGINDLVIPFFVVFLSDVIPQDKAVDTFDVSLLAEEVRNGVEADSFWCLSRLLDGIQDNYTFAQPGIQNKVTQLRELMTRIDDSLHKHLVSQDIDYLQFSFRWFNNVLMRELPLSCTVRLWDTLHAEQEGFSHFLLYVAAAFLKHFSAMLLQQADFQGLMLLLQNLPTSNWSDGEISLVVAEAFKLKYMFADAPKHLKRIVSSNEQHYLSLGK